MFISIHYFGFPVLCLWSKQLAERFDGDLECQPAMSGSVSSPGTPRLVSIGAKDTTRLHIQSERKLAIFWLQPVGGEFLFMRQSGLPPATRLWLSAGTQAKISIPPRTGEVAAKRPRSPPCIFSFGVLMGILLAAHPDIFIFVNQMINLRGQ